MRSLLETISKERKGAPPISARIGDSKDRGGGGGGGGGGGEGGGGGGGCGGSGGGGGGEKKTESKTVAVQTDFPAQLLESYVVKHKARYQTLGNLQEFTGCGLSEHIQK